jgi:hypothetical protein
MSSIAILTREIESLIRRFGDSQFDKEVSSARDGYCERRGRVFDEDEDWENFTRGFLEWYVVERPLQDQGVPPAALVCAELEDDAERSAALRALVTSQRSLVEVCSVGRHGMQVLDLVGNARFAVTEERELVGVQVGNVVEMRLIGFQGEIHLGRSFVFHPDGTSEAISSMASSMRQAGKSRSDIVDHVALLRSRSRSYSHVSPIRIYENPSLVPGDSL